MKVYILRGISGVGKSTFARYLQRTEEEVLVCSADAEMDHGSGYQFDSRRIDDAHKGCLRRFIDGVQKRWTNIVVDNTNLLFHHFNVYISVAEAFGYEVEILTITGDPEVCAERNIHGLDLKKLKRQNKRLNDDIKRNAFPRRIYQRTVCVGSGTWERWGQ